MAYFLTFINSILNVQKPTVFWALLILLASSCNGQGQTAHTEDLKVKPGAFSIYDYLPILAGKRVGVVVNHTSMIQSTHLVDSLLSHGIDIKVIMAPEHGFKGTAYNGEEITDGMYREKILIRSIYGKSKKPSPEDVEMVDVIVFDIQDVGARFYTYISTLHYVMEAAAEGNTQVVILDRPNPNGHYVDGPIRKPGFESFIGMHPVPVVYGMTIGEYGQMINGQGWLKNGIQCSLKVIPNSNYNHDSYYELPIPPSPNLPNQKSILLYPSICFLEGTSVSAGRGTDMQFQVYGHPDFKSTGFGYTPKSMSSSKYPKHQDKYCNAIDLRSISNTELFDEGGLNLSYTFEAYEQLKELEEPFFLKNNFIDKLAGSDEFQAQILSGISAEEIKASWQSDLEKFKLVRSKYLIYR